MSRWTHPMCQGCWTTERGAESPLRVRPMYREDEVCCLCGKPTRSGIYVRRDPAKMPHHIDKATP